MSFQASSSSQIAPGRPFDMHALAILVQRHALTTGTNTTSAGVPTGPPPGFNAEQAKKPLPKEQDAKTGTSPSVTTQPTSPSVPAVATEEVAAISKAPTAEPKTVTEVAEKASEIASGEQLTEVKKEVKKLSILQRIKKEVLHYWDGTKLLATEVKISTKLALKMAAGYELSRREDRQVGLL